MCRTHGRTNGRVEGRTEHTTYLPTYLLASERWDGTGVMARPLENVRISENTTPRQVSLVWSQVDTRTHTSLRTTNDQLTKGDQTNPQQTNDRPESPVRRPQKRFDHPSLHRPLSVCPCNCLRGGKQLRCDGTMCSQRTALGRSTPHESIQRLNSSCEFVPEVFPGIVAPLTRL